MRTATGVLALFGVLLCALGLAGPLLYDYYLLRPWLGHSLIFGAAACIVLAAAWGLGVAHVWLKPVGVVLLAMAGTGLAGLAYIAWAFTGDSSGLSRHPSPDRRMELIAYNTYSAFDPDPDYELIVRTQEGVLSRESDLGCADPERWGLRKIEWVERRTIRFHLDRETVDVALDESGHPDRIVRRGC